ncbi:MAG: hypothetical protein NVS2B17_18330 [Candidatus Velthaea sp.]
MPGFIGLALSEDANAYRLDVEIQQVAFSLTALLQAVSAGGIDVLSVQPQHATPADVFADLVTER